MTLGKHTLVDMYNIEHEAIDNIDQIKKIILDSCKEANLHVVNIIFHKFEPFGLSGVCVLQESHIAIHTWPEYHFVSIDAFTCGNIMNPTLVCQIIAEKLNCTKMSIKEINRGEINE